MRDLHAWCRRPSGQVLLATLLYLFLFTVLFVGLYRAGTTYRLGTKADRASELTALSAGAVYANGLRLVRYSNAILMLSVAVDLGVMGAAIAPFLPEFPLSVPAAIAAARKADPHLRERVHLLQSRLFGIPLPDRKGNRSDPPPPRFPGLYPLLIESEARSAAAGNGLAGLPAPPLFFYNPRSLRALPGSMIPDMALRFRTADELLPSSPSSLYSLVHGGQRHYFQKSQVEPARNPRAPDQMRVRTGLSSPFAGMWVRREKATGPDGSGNLGRITGFGPSTWGLLRDLLKGLVLDVTHREDPHHHTWALYGRFEVPAGRGPSSLHRVSSIRVEGGGLAAWNLLDPPFRVRVESTGLAESAFRHFPGGLSAVPRPFGGSAP